MTFAELLIIELVKLLVGAVGHEKAHQLVSEETQRRANAEADAVAAARVATGT